MSPDLEAKTKGPVGRQLLGVAVNGAGVTRVQHPQIEPARADPERLAQHLRKQAGATHAAPQDMGEAIVLQLPSEGLEILDLLLHLMGRHQPPDPIGDFRQVRVPQRVVERPDPLGSMASGQIGLRRVGHQGERAQVLGAAFMRLAQDGSLASMLWSSLANSRRRSRPLIWVPPPAHRRQCQPARRRRSRPRRRSCRSPATRRRCRGGRTQAGRLWHGVDRVFGGERRDVVGVGQGRILGAGARPQQSLRPRPAAASRCHRSEASRFRHALKAR